MRIAIADGATRREHSIPLSQLAKFYGCSRQRIQAIERAAETISADVRARYCAALQRAIEQENLVARVADFITSERDGRHRRRNSQEKGAATVASWFRRRA
jgi:transcriptional regulator with XRE-family HTH domain